MAPSGREERRLAAVLAVELTDHGARWAADAEAAEALAREVGALIREEVAASGGRLLQEAAGVTEAEFASAASAVSCARAVLQKAAARGATATETRREAVRAAVHAGEFPVEAGAVAGDEVGCARRVLPLVDRWGAGLTEPVWAEVRRQIPLRGRLVAARGRLALPGGWRVFLVPPPSARYFLWSLRRSDPTPAAALAAAAAMGWLAWRWFAAVPAGSAGR